MAESLVMSTTMQSLLMTGFFPRDCPASIVERMAKMCQSNQVTAGTRVFAEGAPDHRFSIIVDGQIDLEMNVPGRGGVRILSLGPGDLLGWSAVLGHGRMTASATARRNSALLTVDGIELRQACEQDHEFGFYIMRYVSSALSRRLLATRLQLLDLFGRESELRRLDRA